LVSELRLGTPKSCNIASDVQFGQASGQVKRGRVYGIADRGSVEVGKAADLVVFDPDTIAPGPLRRVVDFPANGERLTADAPVGMTHTLVNEVPIRVDGHSVPEGLRRRPGKVLHS
jgi:N-acyl-D-aspartate/D-glutamate deacylase